MIQYRVTFSNTHRHFISFEGLFSHDKSEFIQFQLPAWRPGRYELGNFAKNIRSWKARDIEGRELAFIKITKDLWQVNALDCDQVIITYDYYASELNAGSTYLDNEQLYINPVNCFFYNTVAKETPYRIEFELPNGFQIASGLSKESPPVLTASGFDELADCPLIASATLQHHDYQCNGVTFNIWIQGKIQFNTERLLGDFTKFTQAHFDLFGDIPCSEYHFLFHFPPYFVRHGVEHRNSTVIAMGPATEFSSGTPYLDLLAISCHELFHTWNIKCIRPIEMMPYDFTKENYSELGYVAEGVTTYYGDYLLYRCGLLNDEQWHNVLAEAIQEHMDNPGRFNISVAQSSQETWLDGYGAGIPWRKVSIYNEGCLIAYICDSRIRKNTGNKSSLDDVMLRLYNEFGKKGIGYSKHHYKTILEEVGGCSFDDVFTQLIEGTSDYIPHIIDALHFNQLEMRAQPSPKFSEAFCGLAIEEASGKNGITAIYPTGPADIAGLWYGDEILSVNGNAPYKNIQNLLRTGGSKMTVEVNRKNKLIQVLLEPSEQAVMLRYLVARKS
jgi:predicted metalloprotease with PDZ domain